MEMSMTKHETRLMKRAMAEYDDPEFVIREKMDRVESKLSPKKKKKKKKKNPTSYNEQEGE